MLPPARIPLAIFLTSFSPGGTERQMIELLRRLDRRRFAVHLACLRRSGEWQRAAEELAESITEFPISSLYGTHTVRQAASFARWCRQQRIAVLHTCDLYANTFALPAGALAAVPVRIANRRELNPDKSVAHIAAQRFAYGFATRIVANCEAAKRRLRREGIRQGRISVIPNGIDISVFHPGPARDPESQPYRVVTVARFRPEKGLDTFIDAARISLRSEPDLEFALVGDGPLAGALEAQVRTAGLGARVRFLGLRDDVAAVLREHDVFVLPSRSEAFPNAVLEAMATALPTVATCVGGVPELIEHGKSGLLVAPDNPEELAAAIVNLARRPLYARSLGERALVEAERRYSFDLMVSQFEELYLAEVARFRPVIAPSRPSSQPVAS
jgi:glycosyltransferase involved in cell wall biosynthesis